MVPASLAMVLFYQNCSQMAFESVGLNLASSSVSENYLSSQGLPTPQGELCHRWVDGNDKNGVPTWAPLRGECKSASDSILFSVTHENECNTHMACKGYPNDINYRDNILAYMADYNSKDIGSWLKYSALGDKTNNLIQMSIDTINYANLINKTGRPVSDGYMFFGFQELGYNSLANLSDELIIEFDYKVHLSELGSANKSGNRLMLGAALSWDEPARSNKAHYFEINLFKTQGYHDAHFDPNQCTKDASYDHCYYDPNGKWAEGKYVSAANALGISAPAGGENQWHRVQVDLFKLAKGYDWHHEPKDWKLGRIDGIYLGIETRDKSHIWTSLRNFKITHRKAGATSTPSPTPTPNPSPSPSPSPSPTPIQTPNEPPVVNFKFNGTTHPVGLFRDQAAGLQSDGVSVCHFKNGNHLNQTGFSQADYDEARQIPLKNVKLGSVGECKTTQRYGLMRSGQAGLIKHKSGICLIASGEHLQKCGFRQVDYDNAPNISVSNLNQQPACTCP